MLSAVRCVALLRAGSTSAPPSVDLVGAGDGAGARHGNCVIGLRNTGPGKQWVWTDGTVATDFQLWQNSQGAVSANAGRDADALIGQDNDG